MRHDEQRCDDDNDHCRRTRKDGHAVFRRFSIAHGDRFRGPGQTQPVFDVAQGRTTSGIQLQTLPHQAIEGLGDGGRHDGFPASLFIERGRLLGESFDQDETERPDVRCGGDISSRDFRRVAGA
jgi:hypothetical protein